MTTPAPNLSPAMRQRLEELAAIADEVNPADARQLRSLLGIGEQPQHPDELANYLAQTYGNSKKEQKP